jgi:hypothetical protein
MHLSELQMDKQQKFCENLRSGPGPPHSRPLPGVSGPAWNVGQPADRIAQHHTEGSLHRKPTYGKVLGKSRPPDA